MSAMDALIQRMDAVLRKAGKLEARLASLAEPQEAISPLETSWQQLFARQHAILLSVRRLEVLAGLREADAVESDASPPTIRSTAGSSDCGLPSGFTGTDAAPGAVQARLEADLRSRGAATARFARAPSDYYRRPLEARRALLGAPSVHHLCKSVVMANTRAPEGLPEVGASPACSRTFLVIVQYTARLHAEKLRSAVQALSRESDAPLSKKAINLRLAPEEASARLTGFGHNAVSPAGLASPIPVILSHRIALLQPAHFWLGGGEEDLKLALPVDEFVRAFQPAVVDVTYDGALAEEDVAAEE